MGVKEMRDLVESSQDIYEIVDCINQKAMVYAFEATLGIIQKEANMNARKLRARIDVTKKLKKSTKKFIQI